MGVIVGVCGQSGVGKTALAAALVGPLQGRGLVVGYLKHTHEGFDVDREGSDTWRARAAGAAFVAAAGPTSWFQLTDGKGDPLSLAGRMRGCDLVLAEGWHDADWPKVVVVAPGREPRPVRGPVIAEVTAGPAGRVGADVVDSLAERLAALVHDRVPAVELVVDGRPVAVSGFAAEVLARTVGGLLGALRGADGDEVRLVIRRSPQG